MFSGLLVFSSWPSLLWEISDFLVSNPFTTIANVSGGSRGGVEVLFGH